VGVQGRLKMIEWSVAARQLLPAAGRRVTMSNSGRTPTTREILVGARRLVAEGWCQGVDARDERGARSAPWSRESRSWSVLGALVVSAGAGPDVAAHVSDAALGEAVAVLARATNAPSLQAWNDDPARMREDVLGAFDHALELVRADGER
jgi:hypothetical protein